MRLLTLNIWNYTQPWNERRALITDLIANTDPDVVCLQEVRHDFRFEHGRGQGEQIAERAGRRVVSRVAQVYWPWPRVDEGLAILTRSAPERVMVRELTQLAQEREDENHRICLGVTVKESGRSVHVFNTHFSLGPRARLQNARETYRFVAASGEDPAFVFGDLNCEPDSTPIRFLTGDLEVDGERADLVDCWSSLYPDLPGYTYASFHPVRRIDYAFARNLTNSQVHAEIVATESRNGVYPSDHMGILIDVNLSH